MEKRIVQPLEQILAVLKPAGKIILSTYPTDLVPEAFARFGLICRAYEVPRPLGPERIVYVGSRP